MSGLSVSAPGSYEASRCRLASGDDRRVASVVARSPPVNRVDGKLFTLALAVEARRSRAVVFRDVLVLCL